MITLGYSDQSMPSALKIANASEGRIVAVRGDGDINWGRRYSTGLNPDITNAANKRIMRELFAEHGVPAPRLYTPDGARVFFDAERYVPLIGRPDFHTRGRGYWVCHDQADVAKARRGTRRKAAATHFVEFIPFEREFRVHIFQGRSIRISEKAHTEFHKYTTIRPEGRKRHIRRAAKAAVEALGLDFGCVDILADDTTAYVLEVNAAPGLGGSMPRVWADTFIRYMEGEDDE